MNEKDLIERIKKGEKKYFEELVKRYQDRIYNLNIRLLGGNCHREEAEELTQDAFLNAYKGLDGFRENSNFYTWLYRIAINIFHASYRSKPMCAPEPLEDWEDKIVSSINLEEEYLLKEVQELCFSGLITHIPKIERVVFVLTEIQGWSNKQVAEILDITQGATKIRLHRARKRLIDYFGEKCALVKKDNPCKCRMWIDYVREQLKCLPQGWQYEGPRVIDARTIDEDLNDLQRITLFYRSLSTKKLPEDVLAKIRQKIEEGEIFTR